MALIGASVPCAVATDADSMCLSCRSNFKLVAATAKLYAIGGQAVSNVECYSPEQDSWSFVAPLPTPLVEFSACECQGKIYVVGGYTTRGEQLGRPGGTGGQGAGREESLWCVGSVLV